MNRKMWAGVVLMGAALLLIMGLGIGAAAIDPGKAAPDFTLKDVAQGQSYTLSQFKGQVVVLNFITIQCAPCREEMPDLNKIFKENQGKGVQVVGVCLLPDKNQLLHLVKLLGLDYPMLLGTEEMSKAYGNVQLVPTTFIIDRRGKIVQKILGARSKEEFIKLIQPLL